MRIISKTMEDSLLLLPKPHTRLCIELYTNEGNQVKGVEYESNKIHKS